MARKVKAMIISVGGTEAPIVHSLNASKPEYICFFVSKETKKMIDEILPIVNFKLRHYDWITTPNVELLSDSYSQMVKRLPDLLDVSSKKSAWGWARNIVFFMD